MEAGETSAARLRMSIMMFLISFSWILHEARATRWSDFVDLENYPRDS